MAIASNSQSANSQNSTGKSASEFVQKGRVSRKKEVGKQRLEYILHLISPLDSAQDFVCALVKVDALEWKKESK